MDDKTNDVISPEYLRGFNDGYQLAKNEPDIADLLNNVDSNDERMAGFKAGMREVTKEKTKDVYPKWLQNRSDLGLNRKDPDKNMDKGDLDR
jgi:hypothetical protein